MVVLEGTSLGVVGATSTGKSWFLDSAAKVGQTAVAVCPVEERESYKLVEDVAIFMDKNWLPRFGQFQATGWIDLLKWFQQKTDDPKVQIIGFDTGSRLTELAWHEALKMYKTDNPASLGKNWGAPWQQFGGLVDEFLTMISLAVLKGKVVVTLWHGEMREMEGAGEARKKDTAAGREVIWEDSLLPKIRGRTRDSLPTQFSMWLHAGITGEGGATARHLSAQVTTARVGRSRRTLKGGPKFKNDMAEILGAGGLLETSAQ